MLSQHRVNFGWALLLLLPLFGAGLFLRGFWTPDEPREADIIWRMTTQADRSVPQLAAQPFMEKPPLSYWLGAASQKLFGASAAATRIPNLLYLVVASLCVGLLAQHMAGRRAGFIAALIYGSMFMVYQVGIWLAPDALLQAGCALALLGVWRGYTAEKTHDKFIWYTVMHAGAALGFMAKSMPGWLVPGLAVLVLIVMERRWSELRQWTLWAGLLLQLLVIGAWLCNVWQRQDGVYVLRVMFWNNLAGRFSDIHASGMLDYASGHKNWFGKYFVESPYYLFPWFACVYAALNVARQRIFITTDRAWRFALAATLPFVILLSLATTGRGVYFAPACIGFAVLVALWFEALPPHSDQLTSDKSIQPIHWALRITHWAALTMCLVVGLLLAMIGYEVAEVRVRCFLALMVLCGVAGYTARSNNEAPPWRSLVNSYSTVGSCLVLACVGLSPIINQLQDLGKLASAIHQDNAGHKLAILNPDETTIAMLDYGVGGNIAQLNGDDLHQQAEQWLNADDSRRLVSLLPGTSPGPIKKIFKTSARAAEDGLAGELVNKGVAKIVKRYELPDGRRYAVLAKSAE